MDVPLISVYLFLPPNIDSEASKNIKTYFFQTLVTDWHCVLLVCKVQTFQFYWKFLSDRLIMFSSHL